MELEIVSPKVIVEYLIGVCIMVESKFMNELLENKEMIVKKVLNETMKFTRKVFGFNFNKIILYGSYARGDYDEQSDMDLMIVVDIPNSELYKYRDQVAVFSSILSLTYDFTISMQIQNSGVIEEYKNYVPFYSNIEKEGIILNDE